MLLPKKIIFICLFLLPFFANAQFTKNKDSVLHVLRINKKEDSVKVLDYARASQVYNQKPDSAIYYINKGIRLAEKINFQRGIAMLNGKLGTFYLDNGSYKKADSVLRVALKIHKALNRHEDQSVIYQSLSAVYSEAGDEMNALKYVLAGKQIAEKWLLVEQLPFCNGMIGISYSNQGDQVNALKYLNAGLKLTEKLEHNHKFSTAARAYYNLVVQSDLSTTIAGIYAGKKEYPRALSFYEKAMNTSRRGGFYDVNVVLFISAADVYMKTGKTERAKSLLDTALRLANEANLYREKYKIYTQQGMLQSQPEKANVYFNKAIKLASEQKTDLMVIYQDIADYASEKGRFKQAFDALKKYNVLKDSVSGIEKAKQIANLKSVNELNQSEIKVKTLSLENYKVKLNSIIITVISVLLLAIIVAGYFNYKKRKKFYRIVKVQKKNLEELNDMKDRIFYIIGHDLKGPLASVSSLIELMEIDFKDDPAVTEYLSLLKAKQGHSMEILDKLLTWGKLEFQNTSIQTTFKALKAINVTLKGISSGTAQKNIVFNNSIPADLEIKADANHFDFIIRNILQNALKYTPAMGTISLSYQYNEVESLHVFKIEDSGLGMSADQLSNLMKSATSSMPGTANEAGTGIGMMLVKKIADQNNQQIITESTLGEGTVFYYQIPFTN